MFLENVDEMAACFGDADMIATNDFTGLHWVAINVAAGVIVRAKRRAFEGNSGKYAAGTRVAENLSLHPSVGIRGSVAAQRTGGNGSISAQLNLAAENRVHAA